MIKKHIRNRNVICSFKKKKRKVFIEIRLHVYVNLVTKVDGNIACKHDILVGGMVAIEVLFPHGKVFIGKILYFIFVQVYKVYMQKRNDLDMFLPLLT